MAARDRVKSALVGTPVAPIVRTARWHWRLRHLGPHPELHAYYCEERTLTSLFRQLLKPAWNCVDFGAHLGSSLAGCALSDAETKADYYIHDREMR